jgi:hypothetical protein
MPGEENLDAGVMEHISSCMACSEKLKAVLKITRAIGSADDFALPDDFEERVRRSIASTAEKKHGEGRRVFAYPLAAAAAVVFVIITLFNIRPAAIKQSGTVPAKKSNVTAVAAAPGRKVKSPGRTQENMPPRSVPATEKNTQQNDTVLASAIDEGGGKNDAVLSNTSALPASRSPAFQQPAQQPKTAVEADKRSGVSDASVKSGQTQEKMQAGAQVFGTIIHPSNNDTAQVKCSLTVPGQVRIVIYDRNGMIIKRVFSGEKPAGTFTVEWKGELDSGMTASNGIYIMYIKTEEFEQKIKLGVIK